MERVTGIGGIFLEAKDPHALDPQNLCDPQTSPAGRSRDPHISRSVLRSVLTNNEAVVANNLASLLSNHRSDEASIAQAQALAVVLRNSTLPHFNDTLGWLSYLRGDYNTAVRLLEQAAETLPNLPEVRYHLGMSHRKGGDEPKALEHFRRADELEKGPGWLKDRIRAALKEGV